MRELHGLKTDKISSQINYAKQRYYKDNNNNSTMLANKLKKKIFRS